MMETKTLSTNALNGDPGRPFVVQVECTADPDNGMQDAPLPAPVIVLWVLPYGSANMAVGAHLNPALARQLAADLTRMADECEGKR